MIKFFRHIRRSLIQENKMGKYFRYAIGEILLVVIGILIALQINNWNENRKSQAKIDQLLKKVHTELVYNIENAQSVIDFYRTIEKDFSTVLHKKATIEDYTSNKLTYLIWSFVRVNLSDNTANKLDGVSDVLTNSQDSLITRINVLYNDYKKKLDVTDNEMSLSVTTFDNRLKNNTDWYYTENFGKDLPDKAYQYFLNNSVYLNDVANYEVASLRNHLPTSINFITIAKDLYIDLSKYLSIEMDSKIVGDITNLRSFIGTYQFNDNNNKETFVIMEENGKLKCKSTIEGSPKIFSIYPKNAEEFVLNLRFGKLKRNDQNEVIGITTTLGSRAAKHYKKIK